MRKTTTGARAEHPLETYGQSEAEACPSKGKTHQQNRIPVWEIRTFGSKMLLPAEDFDGAALEVNGNQRRSRERRRFAIFLKFANRSARPRNRRHSLEIRTSASSSKQDFHRFRQTTAKLPQEWNFCVCIRLHTSRVYRRCTNFPSEEQNSTNSGSLREPNHR